MKSFNDLRTLLRSIDHKGYPAYKSMSGSWQFPEFVLCIDHVQSDPFAPASNLHVEIETKKTGIPAAYYERDCTRIALQDYLTRQLGTAFEQYQFKVHGSGKSGLLSISRCGQEVLERSACQIDDRRLTVRFQVGFPAHGRTIDAGSLDKILFDFLPRCVENSLFYPRIDKKKLQDCINLAEDQQEIREILTRENLVAFVANGSILPRKTGISSQPMRDSVPFVSPKSMERSFTLPHRGEISGMAVPKGITLIVGGGYHGKSTLLEAIQSGIHNHIHGDGREYVITDDTAVKLRAEDGRSIYHVDISLFINDLPNKKDTKNFVTADASGSTSQAAGVIESMEAGAKLFLVDEDTSATNFMVRDELMQQIISRKKEPITPFIERTRDLYEKAGISTIMVAGSSGAFFYIADQILLMDSYHAVDITAEVKELCGKHKAPEIKAPNFAVPDWNRVLPAYQKKADGHKKYDHMKVKANGLDSFSMDRENVDIRYFEQLVDSEETAGLAYMMRYALEQTLDGKRTLQQTVDIIEEMYRKNGWDAFCGSYVPCGLAKPRRQELFASFNRFRGYK